MEERRVEKRSSQPERGRGPRGEPEGAGRWEAKRIEVCPGEGKEEGEKGFMGQGLNWMLTFPEESWPAPARGTERRWTAADTG